jgi:serine/threonine-protein kinase
MPTATVLDVLAQVGSGLAAAHAKGLVHRDIKPGNLLLTPDGTVKITDFGIARTVDAVPLTATGTVMGTARYLSPEQAMGLSVTAASDVYSLGVVGYEMLSGRPPFEASTPVAQAMAHVHAQPRALPDGVPEPVVALIETMMAKEPEQRPADGAVVVRRVAAVRSGAGAAQPEQTRVLPVMDGQTAVFARPTAPTAAAPAMNAAAARPPAALPPATRPVAQRPPAARPPATRPPAAGTPGARPARGRRAISGPLLALILLVLFVAVGTAFAGDSLRGLFDRGQTPTTNTVTVTETDTPSSSSTSSSTTSSSPSSPTSVSSSDPEPTSQAPTSESPAPPSDTSGTGTGAGDGVNDKTPKPDQADKSDKTNKSDEPNKSDKNGDAAPTAPPSPPSAIEGSN